MIVKGSIEFLYLYTLPETNSQSTWKWMVGRCWKTILSFRGKRHIFRNELLNFRGVYNCYDMIFIDIQWYFPITPLFQLIPSLFFKKLQKIHQATTNRLPTAPHLSPSEVTPFTKGLWTSESCWVAMATTHVEPVTPLKTNMAGWENTSSFMVDIPASHVSFRGWQTNSLYFCLQSIYLHS